MDETHTITGTQKQMNAAQINKMTISNMQLSSELSADNCFDGETLIMDEEGKLYSLDDLAGEYNSQLTMICTDQYGRFTTATAHSFRIGQWVDFLYKVTFSSGHRIKVSAGRLFLGTSGDWIKASDLTFGTVIKGVIYDPSQKNPFLSLNEVTHVHMLEVSEKTPMYDFTLEGNSNPFIAQKLGEQVSLITTKNSL